MIAGRVYNFTNSERRQLLMLHKASVLFFVLVLLFSLQVLPAFSDQIKSDFSTAGSVDGWSVFSDYSGTPASDNPSWSGGVLSAHDFGVGYYWLVAPDKFTGNLSSYIGGSLTYQIKYDGTVTSGNYLHPSVVVTRGNQKLWKRCADPGSSFTSYSYTLNSSDGWMIYTSSSWSQIDNWTSLSCAATDVDIAYILAAVDNLYIRGDMSKGNTTDDAVSLDNVYLSDTATASTPEPSSLLSLIGGFGAFGVVFARFRKR